MAKKVILYVAFSLVLLTLQGCIVLCQEPVFFNGLELGAHYDWKICKSGGGEYTVSVIVDDMEAEEDYTIYYLTYVDPNYTSGISIEVNLTWDEDVMLLFEYANISLPDIVVYLWWNASLLDYAMENETLKEEYNISDIKYGKIMYGFSPRKVLIVELDDGEITIDVGTGVVLSGSLLGVSVELSYTNMIKKSAILYSVILLVVLACLAILFLKLGIKKIGGEKK